MHSLGRLGLAVLAVVFASTTAEAFTYKPKIIYRSGNWKVVLTKGKYVETCEIMSVNNQVSYGLWGDPPEFEIGIINSHRAKEGSSGRALLTFLPSHDTASAQFEVIAGGSIIMLRSDKASFAQIMNSSEIQVDFDNVGYSLNANVPLKVLMEYNKCLSGIVKRYQRYKP